VRSHVRFHVLQCATKTMVDRPLPRYAPASPLPARAFIPGVSPSAERPDDRTPRRAELPRDLVADDDFRLGVDLLNHGFPWEAHEIWESLWHAAPQASRERALLQGLILAAAASVKAFAHQWVGARKLAESAAEQLDAAGHLAGVDGATLATTLRAWTHHAEHGLPAPLVYLE
jgi:hypothetical protein